MSFLTNDSGIGNFCNNIAGGISKGFLGSENTNRSLSDAAQKLYDLLDKTANRTYINTGFANNDKTLPNNRNVITQTPEMIILIKKRMFSSLSDNYRYELMDKDEKHFIRAAKKLFENKCEDISSYEKLTKITKIVQENQALNSPIAQMIYQTLNSLDGCEYNLSEDSPYAEYMGAGSAIGNFQNLTKSQINSQGWAQGIFENRTIVKKLRQLLTLNGFNQTTTWIKDSNFEPRNSLGKGTGVIELTLVKTASFTTSLEFEGGSGQINISDPYRLFFIDEADIEKAIFQTATSKFSNIDSAAELLEQENDEWKQELNGLRAKRGASTITYKIDINTRIYNRVSVILDSIGIELTKADGSGIDYDKLNNQNISTFEQFKPAERTLLDDIYNNLFKIIQSKSRNYEDYRKYNDQSNNVRKEMRLNFMGKQIIQPMDTVTAFVDSQTIDDKALLFNLQESFLAGATNIGGAIDYISGSKFPPIASNAAATFGSTNLVALLSKTIGQKNLQTQIKAEKNILAGPDFPDWLYSALRPNFTSQSFGTCIFSGIVKTVTESYNDGLYSVSVTCGSNADYFSQGWIQTKPGLDQFNGALYDPVTPFNFKFDVSNGLPPETSQFDLLPENKEFIRSNLFKFASGKQSGQIITEDNFNNTDFEPIEGLSKSTGTYASLSKKVFQIPDGFVHKWKKGIGTAWINQSGSPDGLINNKLLHENIAQVTQEDAFGGQDLVNVLSMLICGEPYNLNTFLKTSMHNENGATNTFNPTTDYFQGLLKLVTKQNKIWGNFIPFKKLDVDPKTFAQAMRLQLTNAANNSTIKKLQDQKASLLQNLMQIEGAGFSFDISNYSAPLNNNYLTNSSSRIKTNHRSITFQLIKKIVQLDAEIQLTEAAIRNTFLNTNITKSIAVIGSNLFYDNNILKTGADAAASYKLTLAKQNELTKRRIWQVKGNSDQNLFIVGSEYDNDFDLQAILFNPTSDMSHINVSWTKPIEKIKAVAQIIGMELFVNSQGHIEFRVPRYNRVPSSIIFEMLRRKKEHNIQIYPDFLEKTLENKIEAAFKNIEIIEDQIRLRGIALGAKNNSKEIATLLTGSLTSSNSKFIFVTDEKGQLTEIIKAVNEITQKDYSDYDKSITEPKNLPTYWVANINEKVGEFFKRKSNLVKNFQIAANTFNSFDIIQQDTTLKTAYKNFNSSQSFILNQQNQAESIRARLAGKLNVPLDGPSVPTIPQLLPNSKNGKLSAIDANAVIQELDSLVTKRYESLTSAVNLIRNLDQAAKMNSQDTSVYQQLLMPGLYGEQDVPEFLKNMVENELEDDYGANSGKRFIIKESDIISMNYKEEGPDFTSVIVSGSELGGVASGMGGFQLSNAGLSQAWAVDYDLWRMYGAKEATGKHLPFFSDAQTQLAPYAVFLLNQQRANILRGEIVIRGNEFVQPGEVYYIQERGMLFYSRSVTHEFSYGNSFKTNISLCYGHAPGEYIPTPLDAIGKNMYNGHYANTGNYKTVKPGTEKTCLNTLIFPNKEGDPVKQLYEGSFGEKNKQAIEDVAAKINLLMENTIPVINTGMQAVTVRIYVNANSGFNENIYAAANYVVGQLIMQYLDKSSVVGKNYNSKKLIPGAVMVVDLDSKYDIRNPSSLALSYVKNDNLIKLSENFDEDLAKKDKSYLFSTKLCNSIIDIWLERDIVANEAIVASSSHKAGSGSSSTTKSLTLESMTSHFNTLSYNNLIK